MSLWGQIPEQTSPAELFPIALLFAKPKQCFVKYPAMVFKLRAWVCTSCKKTVQCHGPCGWGQTAPHWVSGSHLYPLLLQVNAVCEVLAGDDVRVLVLMEQRLQGLQLLLGEYGAVPACPALDLVATLQLGRVPLGTLTDPGC